MKREESWLYLEDGTEIKGLSFGSHTEKQGDVVFTTVMNGYPESFTDPSYKGQMLVMSHPLVGNYGVPRESYKNGILENLESEHVTIEGLIVTEVTDGGKWNKGRSLDDWLKENNVPGIAGIDTRFLIKKIRENGVLRGIISNDRLDAEDRFEEVYEKTNFVEKVSVKKPIEYAGKTDDKIVVLDLGVKHGILQNLSERGYTIVRVPYDYTAEKIMDYDPKGIVYSNGPGDPHLLKKQITELNEVMKYEVPILGICLGHQLITLAFGGIVKKMKYGHRATNKAVVETGKGRAYITTHNHGYASYSEDVPKDVEIWFKSPDDGVIEGLRTKNVITTQFHPEARPGPKDAEFVFDVFDKMIKNEG